MKFNLYIFIIIIIKIIMDKITSITNGDMPTSNLSSIISDSNSNSVSSSSLWENIKNIPLFLWIIIILILALLGFNIFIYLAEGTQGVINFFKPILAILGLTTKNIVDVSLEGSKQIVTGTANIYDKTATTIQNKLDSVGPTVNTSINSSTASTTLNNDPYPSSSNNAIDDAQANSLNKALNSAQSDNNNSNVDYEADDSSSSIQMGGSSSKAGWCFIGTDKGIRTCGEVGVHDTCMSGDIFPSHEICINPTLRP